jgi:superfamily I DNA/RNA helicase/RecB family exonuclease
MATVTPGTSSPTYRLVRPSTMAVVPELDDQQRLVVEHPGGPLLVLAGPGTGKTTTLVEAIVRRIEEGAHPDSVLALTFSRKAAEQLRDRVAARVGRTMSASIGSTFHSFAYGLIRAKAPADIYEGPLRLLSAPEQDVVLQELLTDAPESIRWPESLKFAVGTRGFAREVQAVLSRAREKGLEGPDLIRLGEENGRPEYVAAGAFLDQYLDVLDSQAAVDYADLIRRAAKVADEHRDELRTRYAHVFVDEYQDTDPSQVALVQHLAGDGRNLVVVGDPHQSIYAFRGAEVRGILQFPAQFPQADGTPADIAVLRTTRRFGPELAEATRRVAARLPLGGGIPAETAQAFLQPEPDASAPPGRVEVFTAANDRAEGEHLGDLLRRAHLEDGLAWSEMAVLVRSGRQTIPALRRALSSAGVPVEVAADDTPMVREPAVQVLVSALSAVLHLDETDPSVAGYVDPVRAEGLLASPLAGLDVADVRVLARALRAAETAAAAAEDRVPLGSPDLLRSAVVDADGLASVGAADVDAVAKAVGLAALLRRARDVLVAGGSSEEVLWTLWSGTGWPERLRAATERAGGAAARSAHRDLDAVLALFDEAARVEGNRGHTGLESFLATIAAQQIPADTLAERGVRGDAVRLLTAHRSKGLEWRLVVVAHVQEDGWPDIRRRATLLQADRIGVDGLIEPTSTRTLLADERRLFYVACTRARERLVVSAVRSSDEDGEQPSRFLAELVPDTDLWVHHASRPERPLSLDGLVAELRRTCADDTVDDALRHAAARRLVVLAEAHRTNEAWVPAADPASWWGLRAPSRSDEPLRTPGEPVRISASTLTSLETCPAQWFLTSEARAERASTQAQGFGNVAHAIADRLGRQELDGGAVPDVAQVDELMAHVDRVWGQVPFRTPWSGERERDELRKALQRFVAWRQGPDARELLATEERLDALVELPDGTKVQLYGYADRLELDADGRVVVVDLKTGKYPPTNDEVAAHPQLGLYQLAVEHGAVERLAPDAEHGGAELWQLRKDVRGVLKVQRQDPQQSGEDGVRTIERQLSTAVARLRDEEFPARPGEQCGHCDFVVMCPAHHSGTVLS